MKNQRWHWLCRMLMGRNNDLMSRTYTRIIVPYRQAWDSGYGHMANRVSKLKMEVSTPSQACLTRKTGESGPAFLEVPPTISGQPSNAACHFFRINVDTVQFPQNQLRPRSIRKNWPHVQMKRRYIAGNLLFFSPKVSLKIVTTPLENREERV